MECALRELELEHEHELEHVHKYYIYEFMYVSVDLFVTFNIFFHSALDICVCMFMPWLKRYILKFDATAMLYHNFTLHSIAMIEIFPWHDDESPQTSTMKKEKNPLCHRFDEIIIFEFHNDNIQMYVYVYRVYI